MILVADSGSTKTDWRLINGTEVRQFTCRGLNPDFNTSEEVESAVSEAFQAIDLNAIDTVFFYGSGCSSPVRSDIVKQGLANVFTKTEIFVFHDLLGAARAACGKEKGIAGILGTGSNACLFDGKEIVKSYRSGGYIIGDEGGGVSIGKQVVKAFIEDDLPSELRIKFEKRYQLSVDEILHKLYKEELPNRFLASFSQFAYHHREEVFMSQLIHNAFENYFNVQILRLENYQYLTLSLVGSIAFYYQEFIRRVAAQHGVRIGTILEKPISGLSLYHSNLG